MIDPDGIQLQQQNLPDIIKITNVPEFDIEIYNLDDDKEYEHYVKDLEREVRKSFEYRAFIRYLRENMDMNKCSFLVGVSNFETYDIKIEIHHYPFSLRDVCEIVIRKRQYYHEPMALQMVAKEVMMLHYKLLIGLIPLSETVHQLAHSGRLFIPVDRVLGRYNIFVEYYEPFCDQAQLDTLKRIEKYTFEHSPIQDSTILEQNTVQYEINEDRFALPQFDNISTEMINRIDTIRNNNYLLPVAGEKEIIRPIEFDMSLIKK